MLRKIVAVVVIITALEGVALAATVMITTLTGSASGSFNFKPSKDVVMVYLNDGATSPQAYTLSAKHTSGDRLYSASNISPNIWYKTDATTLAAGTALTTSTTGLPTVAGESVYTGWTQL